MKNAIILRRILIGGIFASLLIPFINFSNLYFPFITGKAYLFRILVEVMFGIWIIAAIFDKDSRPKKSKILWSGFAFMIILFIANIQGTNPSYSFWSNYERMEGYVTLLHISAYFIIIASVFNTKKLWEYLLNFLIATSIIQSFYSISQLASKTISSGRIEGTFGNAIYLAAFMLFTFFCSMYLLMKENPKHSSAKYFYIVAMFLQVISIFLTATRGTVIALFVGTFVALALISILEPTKKVLRNSLIGFILISVLFATIVFGFKNSSLVQDNFALKRISETSLSGGTVKARFINWGIAWGAIKEKPILGYGQGNYGLIFDKNYDVRMWNQEQWFDRAHSLIFDWLIAGGFLGLISYLLIVVSALYCLWNKKNNFSNSEKSVLTAFFVAYVIHTIFVFDSLTSYMILAIILALIHSRSSIDFDSFKKIKLSENLIIIIIAFVIIATPYSVWAFNYNSLAQNIETIKALKPTSVGEVDDSLEYFKSAMARGSFGRQETLLQMMDFGANVINSQSVSKELKQEYIDFIIPEIRQYVTEYPNDSRILFLSGQFMVQAGNWELGTQLIDSAISISPKKQFMYKLKIEMLIQQGKDKEALELAKKVYEINPDNDDIWKNYIKTASRVKENKIYDFLIEDAYNNKKGYRVVSLAEENLKSNIDNVQAYVTLAFSNYRNNSPDKAVEILNQAIEKFPESKTQLELVIEKIEAGESIF